MTISYIVAMDQSRGIGTNNRLPWHLPADLAYFRKKTTGHTILMGRKTYDSIGKPLPKRHNVVLTRDRSFAAEGVEVLHSPEETAELYGQTGPHRDEELFVIGGAEIFKLLIPYADRMYVTEIAHTFDAEVFFPEIDAGEWIAVSREPGVKDEKNPYDYTFVTYERK
ncbi:dihydrofolate reductase [Paenibacillus filicis]|uniref:Dihydrofolate reductase n=1 Tax=Paenibacillus gyeongsangnamensis TaxID=3388067 RepID=A0ABT4QFL8_9BACL|nr:dihydrofolate reductase [Paenibacillus filicis]MCZ8515541.1 dihydrofolate reductase [Paenibacillus filicis]